MSYNFKKIIDLDLVEEVPEGANVLIETDGATKRVPSDAIKPAPVQSNMSQNDPSAPDYVKNRTHYEDQEIVNEPLNITWDGNTEGLVNPDNFILYKVSDLVLTNEQLKTATITLKNNVDNEEFSYVLEEDFEYCFEEGLITEDCALLEHVVCVRKSGTYNDLYFAETGIYFTSQVTNQTQGVVAYVSSLATTEPVEQTKTVVKKLDKKFLPDDIGGYTIFYVDFIDEKIYIDESIETEANSVDVETALSKGVIYFKKAHTGELYNSFELETGDSGYYIRILTMNYGNVNVQSVATSDFIGGAD